MSKKKNGFKKISWFIGGFMILLEFLILAIIVFDNSPKDWGSLMPPLIIIPIIGLSLLMIGKNSMQNKLSLERKKSIPSTMPNIQSKSINRSQIKRPLFIPNDILCMAIVYEGYLPKGYQINNIELATEIMTQTHAIGSLANIRLNENTMIRVQRANENAFYQGDYEPKDALPTMIQTLQRELRVKMMANGDQVDQVSIKNLMFKSHSNIAGTLWVQLNVLQ